MRHKIHTIMIVPEMVCTSGGFGLWVVMNRMYAPVITTTLIIASRMIKDVWGTNWATMLPIEFPTLASVTAK